MATLTMPNKTESQGAVNQQSDLSKRPPSRRARPMIAGRRDVLVVRNKEPGFVYRVVNANDAADMQRIEDLKEIGYEFVSNPTTADPTANTAGSVGTSSKIATGGGTFGYVMRIRKEYYDEDQAAKQREVRATELATMDKATHKEVDFGSVAITNR